MCGSTGAVPEDGDYCEVDMGEGPMYTGDGVRQAPPDTVSAGVPTKPIGYDWRLGMPQR